MFPQSSDPRNCRYPLDTIQVQINRSAGVGITDHGHHGYIGNHLEVQTIPKRSLAKRIQNTYTPSDFYSYGIHYTDWAPLYGLIY